MSSPSDHLLLQRYSFHLTASALTTETPETTATTTPSAAVATVTTATMVPETSEPEKERKIMKTMLLSFTGSKVACLSITTSLARRATT